MGSSIGFNIINLGWSIVHIKRPEVFPLITNSVDPDEVPHFARFHLVHHCLQNCLIVGFQYTKGY